jgi:uncharacterized membrane protein YidH (DUF202 family)
MNLQWKRASYTLLLFGILFLFLVVDLIVIGIDNYLNRGHFLLVAAMILVTMIVYFFMLYQTKNSDHLIDERDNVIQQKATSVALMITVMFVFLVSIGLFLVYENDGSLPVAWLWIQAYLTYTMAYTSSSFITVVLYRRDNVS